MRHCAKTDRNQAEIIAALRRCGWSVQDLSKVGCGCPDILVGAAGINVLLEIKDSAKFASQKKLTPAQVNWHRAWQGLAVVVETPEQAIAQVRAASQFHAWN